MNSRRNSGQFFLHGCSHTHFNSTFFQAYQLLDEPHLAQMNFSWALSLDPQGTNTMIKEAMNQQRFASIDETTLEDDIDDAFSLNDNNTADAGVDGDPVDVEEQEMSDV